MVEVVPGHNVKVNVGVEEEIHPLLNSALYGGERLASCTGHISPEERDHSTHLIGGGCTNCRFCLESPLPGIKP
jgi:hypothetical protein